MKNLHGKASLIPILCLFMITHSLLGSTLFNSTFNHIHNKALNPGSLNPVVWPQQQEVQGTVTDSRGQPIPGVSIQRKGAPGGSSTDLKGYYTLGASAKDTLLFSYLGHQTVTIPVNGHSVINVQLQQVATALEAIQLNAGYYTVTDRERTGSIARMTAASIGQQPVTNPLASLQGRMPGVQITQNTGVPGGGFDIKIRGTNSLRSNANDPLIIVDGVPYATETLGYDQVSGSILPGLGFSPLNSINPADIQNIEVLKDADATAIYGSRGANGVVLITTKKGRSGKTQLMLNAYSGFGEVTHTADLLKTAQYLEMRREAFANDGISPYPANAYDVNGTWDQDRYTDWQDELLGGTAHFFNASASVSGGDAQNRFLLSSGYQRETTVFSGDYRYHKGSVHLNLTHRSPNERFLAQVTASYLTDTNNLPGNDFTSEAQRLAPNAPPVYDEEGNLNWANSTWNNPLRLLEDAYLAKTHTLIANGTLQYTLLPGLMLKTSLGYTENGVKELKTSPSTAYNPAYGVGSESSAAFHNTADQHSWILEPQLSWEQDMDAHHLEVLLGGTLQEQKREQFGQYAYGFSSNSLITNLSAASSVYILNDVDTAYKYAAAFGRVNYQYKGKYLLNLTGRRDGSSRFGSGKQWGNFGAVGAAWIFTEEAWLQNTLPFISFGKLRGSYGLTGSDQIGDYQFYETFSVTGQSYGGVTGLQPTRLYNPDFGWESNRKTELAVELGFFKDRINLSAAYYNNRSSNQLVGIPLPATTGFGSILSNLDATVENKGWELEWHSFNVQALDFKWETGINLTIPENKLVSFPGLESSTYVNQYVIGEPLNIRKVFQYTGLDSETGVYQFEDFNADGLITTPEDRQAVVRLDPDFYGGMSNTLSYKNWQLDFFVQFVKQEGFDYSFQGGRPGGTSNQPLEILDRWQEPGDQKPIQRFTSGGYDAANRAYSNVRSSTHAFADASYLRLKTVSLSFNVPERYLRQVKCRLYAQGQNLLLFTKYKGYDPENQSISSLPPLRVITTGIELTF